MLFYIWLDDIRPIPITPFVNTFWAKSYRQAINFLKLNIRDCDNIYIDFDHDLGGNKTGYDLAKWLVKEGYQGEFSIHSQNPVGAKNIQNILLKYGWSQRR